MTPRLTAWLLALPATLLVALFLGLPVLATFATTVDPAEPAANYAQFFGSRFRMTVLWRTMEVALVTTAVSLLIGFPTAWVVARSSPRVKSVLIIAAVFPLLTGVVVRSFAWLVILGRNGIVNETLLALGLIAEPLTLVRNEFGIIVGETAADRVVPRSGFTAQLTLFASGAMAFLAVFALALSFSQSNPALRVAGMGLTFSMIGATAALCLLQALA